MSVKELGITFAGGGSSSFYQLGLMRRWRERLLPDVAIMSSVSAGACVATLMLSGREAEAGELWTERSRGITSNFDWRRLLVGERPTPHESIYRDLLLHAFADGGFERVRSQPFPVMILTTAFPRRVPPIGAAMLGVCAYNLERMLRKQSLHQTLGRKIGFTPIVFDARDCRKPAELVDLIIASSATPPFTSVGAFSGRRLLDGGLIDNAPAFLVDDAPGVLRNLVLLTRHYPASLIGRRGSRLYLAPSRPLTLKPWDYTHPESISEIVALGERDADSYEDLLAAFLGSPA